MTIDELIRESHACALSKGWWDAEAGGTGFLEKCMLVVGEISEMVEEYRAFGLDDSRFMYYKGDKPEGIAVEAADVFIRLADLCGRHNIDLEAALVAKQAYNRTRTYRHGNLKA